MAGDNVIVKKAPEGIVSETAYATLILAAAQARNNFVDFMTAWGELATFKREGRSSIIADGSLASSGTNRGGRSDSKHVIGGKEDGKKKRTYEAKARSKNNKIKK
jgi:hypothetical protein